MSDHQSQSHIFALEQELDQLKHENAMLKAHLAMFTRRLADPEHDKRVADRRKQAYAFVNERRAGFDRRGRVNGLKG